MILYHITSIDNIRSIISDGILPASCQTSYKKNSGIGQECLLDKVYVTNDPNTVIGCQGCPKDPVVVKVNVKNYYPVVYDGFRAFLAANTSFLDFFLYSPSGDTIMDS